MEGMDFEWEEEPAVTAIFFPDLNHRLYEKFYKKLPKYMWLGFIG